MKLGYNTATTKENASLAEELVLCDKHGYDYFEIQMDKLPAYLENHSLDEMAAFFKTHHLKLLALNALVFFNNRSDEDEKKIIEEFKEMLRIGKKLGAKYIVAVPLVTDQKILKEKIKNSCVSILTKLSDLAEESGIKIALEFLGAPTATVNTFAQGYEIVQAVNRDNVGLVLDCFHFHGMGSRLEDLRNADGSKIFILHVNDTDDYPIGILTDEDRIWPGHGAIDLDGIMSTLKEINFPAEVTSIELFRPEYYQMDPEVVIKTAKATMAEVVSKYWEVDEPANAK